MRSVIVAVGSALTWPEVSAGRGEGRTTDFNQIRYFLNLADTLNFTEAAMRSGVSQPTLTRAIQRLEQELGGTLVYRDGKDSRLTALGAMYDPNSWRSQTASSGFGRYPSTGFMAAGKL